MHANPLFDDFYCMFNRNNFDNLERNESKINLCCAYL